jgi:hypothetical protein
VFWRERCGHTCRAVTEGQPLPLAELAERFEHDRHALLQQLVTLHAQSRYSGGDRLSHLLLHLDFRSATAV